MVYTAVQLGPTAGQMSDLADGTEIMLNATHTKGDVIFHLTNAQLARVTKAREAGKGCRLKLSAAQIKHMGMYGSGKFTDMLKDLGRTGLKAGVNFAVDKGTEALTGLAKTGIEKGAKAVGKKVKQVAGLEGDGLFDWVGSLGGTLTQQKQLARMHKQHGAGWLGGILKKLAHGGVDVVAGALGAGLGEGLTKTEIAQLRKMEQQHGRGFFGNILKKLAHGTVDVVGDALGAGVGEVNPHASPNEALRAALMQKKVTVPAFGQGLTYP